MKRRAIVIPDENTGDEGGGPDGGADGGGTGGTGTGAGSSSSGKGTSSGKAIELGNVRSVKPIDKFSAQGINPEFQQPSFSFQVGEVLAADEPKVSIIYWSTLLAALIVRSS